MNNSTISIAATALKVFNLHFYFNTRRNKEEFKNELTLIQRINIWFKEILNQPVLTKYVSGRPIPCYSEKAIDLTFEKYRDVFELFLNTHSYRINIKYFKDIINHIDMYGNDYDFEDDSDEDEFDDINDSNTMEAVSDYLLKQDGIFGYIEED